MKKIFFITISLITFFTFLFFSKSNEKYISEINGLTIYKSDLNYLKSSIRDINKNTNVKINLKYIVDDSKDLSDVDVWKCITDFLSNENNLKDIDILMNIPYAYQKILIKNDKLLDLSNEINPDIMSNIYNPILDISKKIGNGKIYFLSPTFTTQFFAINEDYLSENSLYKKGNITWDEFEIELESMSNSKNREIFSIGISGVEGFFSELEILLTQLSIPFKDGANIFEDTTLTNEFARLIKIYKQYGYKGDDISEENDFYSGNIAVRLIYPPQLEELSNLKNNYIIMQTPKYSDMIDTVNIRIQPYSILKNTKNKESSLKVLNYIHGKKFALKLIKNDNIFIAGGDYVSYKEDDIISLYKKKLSLDNVDFLYEGTKGSLYESDFSYSEYLTFYDVGNKFTTDMINSSISISEGIEKLKYEFYNKILTRD